MTIPQLSIILSIIGLVCGAVFYIFWRLWDVSQRNHSKELEAEYQARKQAIENLERWVVGEANTAREYHDQDSRAIRESASSQGREIGEIKRRIENVERDTGSHRTDIALLSQLLGSIKDGVDEIKASLKKERQ